MHPRIICNVVYAHLIGDAGQDDRDKFNAELYSPLGGEVNVAARLQSIVEG